MKNLVLSVLAATFLLSCQQGAPNFNGREGDNLAFSGRVWQIKNYENTLVGPGNNYFTNHPNDVFVDNDGYLHLTVTERNGKWRSTEVISTDSMSYGTYTWTIQGDPVNIDQNIVLGLFTWDDSTFFEEANSEVDIEFSKWGEDTVKRTLQYGVQPISFDCGYFDDRVDKPEVPTETYIGVSTHSFTWTDTLISWVSYTGDTYGQGDTIATWDFDLNNSPKQKCENGAISKPIVIPAPGKNTNARMNLWLVAGANVGPVIPLRHEIIIRKFEYTPLQ